MRAIDFVMTSGSGEEETESERIQVNREEGTGSVAFGKYALRPHTKPSVIESEKTPR